MSLLVSAFVRLIPIFFALFVALIAAGLLFGFGLASGLFPEMMTDGNSGAGHDEGFEFFILAIATVGFGAIASFQLAGVLGIPLIIAILATELMRWQGMVVHLVLGGLVALFVMFTQLPAEVTPKEGTIIVTLAAGFIAAFFYWLIAGRNAGNWLKGSAPLGKQDADSEG